MANEWWRNPISATNPAQRGGTAAAPAANPQAAATSQALGGKKQGTGWTAPGQSGSFGFDDKGVGFGQYSGNLEGFDSSKFDPSHADYNNIKYIFGRAASQVDPYSEGAVNKVADLLNQWGLGATVEGSHGDRIRFGTGESIDVLRNAGRVGGDPNASLGWQWIDAAYDGQPTAGFMGGADQGGADYSDQGVNAGEMPTAPGLGADGGGDAERQALMQALAEKQQNQRNLGQIGSF